MGESPAFRLQIEYKGNRSYLHGTDLFDALIELAHATCGEPWSSVRMSFYRPITCAVEAIRLPPQSAANFHPAALLELQINRQPVIWAVRERPDDQVEGRRPYDESLVTAGATFEGRSIIQQRPTPYTFIERLVALNKRLLDHSRQDAGVSWWFSRLELRQPPPKAPSLRLGIKTELASRLIKSSIDVDGERTGSIYFSEKAA